MSAALKWLNEPPRWEETGDELTVATGDKTDFWRETHYGFIRDDGHLRYREVSGDFTATLSFNGDYQTLYDQAGIMLRLDAQNWIKAGVELVQNRMLSAVVTRDFSDWSTGPLPEAADWITLRCTRLGSAVRLEWSDGQSPFKLFRLAYLPARDPIQVGPMCCSPQRAGFAARFRSFEIASATSDALHD